MVDLATIAILISALALVVSVLGLGLQYLDFFQKRREKLPPVTVEVFNEPIKTPLESEWSIRVRSVGNTLLEHCRVQFGGQGIHTIDSQKRGVWEAMLTKGGAVNFRIPIITPVADDAWVVVLDGERVIRKDRFGTLPHTSP